MIKKYSSIEKLNEEKTFLITGATGFLGQALIKRIYAQDFEKTASENAKNDNNLIFSTLPCAWDWVQAGALSSRHPNKVNILGVEHDDVEEMINIGIFDRSSLQLGMNIFQNPSYI